MKGRLLARDIATTTWSPIAPVSETNLMSPNVALSAIERRKWKMLRQMDAYLRDKGMAGLASVWAMARRRPI